MRKVWHLHHVGLFLFALDFSVGNIWLEPFSKIDSAHNGVDYRDDDEDDGDDSECCQRFANGDVFQGSVGFLIHSDQLEKKVGQSAKI